jgi:hypothetical protein
MNPLDNQFVIQLQRRNLLLADYPDSFPPEIHLLHRKLFCGVMKFLATRSLSVLYTNPLKRKSQFISNDDHDNNLQTQSDSSLEQSHQ